jgi:septum formation protein
MQNDNRTLILASTSTARQTLLAQSGLAFTAVPSGVDEAVLKTRFAGTPAELAMALAQAKAAAVSAANPEAWVIGADQILLCGGKMFDKPADLAAAAGHLAALNGQTHELLTACCVVRHGAVVWQDLATPRLTMRDCSPAFLADYLAAEGDAVCQCVGAYRLEGQGIQLFAAIEGDFFTILGLNLLALLAFLRRAGVVPG